MSKAAVYRITCLATGWQYIGVAVNAADRWHRHFWALEMGVHSNRRLQADWVLFGSGQFEFALLEQISAPYDQIQSWRHRRERYWIARAYRQGPCYNQPFNHKRCQHCGNELSKKILPVWRCHCLVPLVIKKRPRAS